jgi:hypothetical protein
MGVKEFISSLLDIVLLLVSAIALVIFGLIFYLVNLWIIKFSSIDVLGLTVSGDWLVISAAILTAAAMIGSIRRRT